MSATSGGKQADLGHIATNTRPENKQVQAPREGSSESKVYPILKYGNRSLPLLLLLPVSVPPETPTIVVRSTGKGYKMDRRNRQRAQQSFAEPFVIHISVSVELDFWVSASRRHPIILHHCYPLINLLITFN